VGVSSRLMNWRSFKPIFFKYLFNIYLVGAGLNWFSITFTLRYLCKTSRVETWVKMALYFRYSTKPRAAACLARPLVQPVTTSCQLQVAGSTTHYMRFIRSQLLIIWSLESSGMYCRVVK
jgi:hypothetical protein